VVKVAEDVYTGFVFETSIAETRPAGEETAFLATPLSTTRTTFKLLPYDKKFAAVKKYPAVVSFGLPNSLTKFVSEV
jgi:hypothetical protein